MNTSQYNILHWEEAYEKKNVQEKLDATIMQVCRFSHVVLDHWFLITGQLLT